MYLKRLELQGFKSFADKTVLELKEGITSVIGPNGSGKSNISDCIRWILGEQSMKSLRGAKSQDIIFAGTQNRKPLGFAEASLVFDNSDGTLPIEYTEVTITRKIFRSGEITYYINKVPCRLKDILELVMDTGIGKDGYSLIGQGKIDEILSNKSEDRRHIFEEAAGIVKYRVRKQETEKKLEQTKLNLLRINDILVEIESNIDPLKQQSEKAKKYMSLKEELKDIEVGLFLHNIEKYKCELEDITKNEEIYVSQVKDEEENLNKIQMLKEELKKELEQIIEQIEEVSNAGFEKEKEVEVLNSSIEVAKTKIENSKENIERLMLEIEDVNAKVGELKDERDGKSEKKISLLASKERFVKELNEKEQQLSSISQNLSSKELEIEELKRKIDEDIETKYELQSQISIQENNLDNISSLNIQNKKEQEIAISELDKTRMAKEEIANDFYEIDNKRNKILKTVNEISKNKEEADVRIKEYEILINNTSNEIRMKESRLNFLKETEREKEGYAKAVKDLLIAIEKDDKLGNGVKGVLANLIDVPDKYQTAIEMKLGFAMQNIVTKNQEDAKKLIEYLRQNNLGRASFLPISSVKGQKIKDIKTKCQGYIGIAADLIKYDKEYEGIIFSLLGKTVVVDNMDSAISISKEHNNQLMIVTLKGDIVNPSGLISGGSVAKKTVNILGRGNEIKNIQKELNELKIKLANVEKDKVIYEESISNILEESTMLEKELQEIEISYATRKEKLEYINQNIEKLDVKKETLKEKYVENCDKEELCTQKLEEIKLAIKEIEEKVCCDTSVVNEFSKVNKERQQEIDDLNFDVTNLKISVSSFDESESSILELEERIDNEILDLEGKVVLKNKTIENINSEIINLESSICDIGAKIEELKLNAKTSEEDILMLKNTRQEKNELLSSKEEELTFKFKALEDLNAQVVKVQVRKTRVEEEITSIVNKMWEEYELTPNASEKYAKPENVQTTTRRVNELRTNLKELGSVNVDAIEEYKQLKERYDTMSVQRLDLEDTIAKLRNIIMDMTNIMKEDFKKKFEEINKNFNEVFKELFGGGMASLSLADENDILECGIDINVQPPGKKLQSMTLLSGGEKAFTAIALLFGILKINPAPFCVLDEIEAALDDVNVFRYAEYLKKFVKDTQFLVITHRKGTMEVADSVYGVTMEESGISKLLSMQLKEIGE